jgi:hypothetical protein
MESRLFCPGIAVVVKIESNNATKREQWKYFEIDMCCFCVLHYDVYFELNFYQVGCQIMTQKHFHLYPKW